MRVLLLSLFLLATFARAEEAPTPVEAASPTSWGKESFQERSRAEARKLAEDLLGDKTPAPAPDKTDNQSSK